MFKKKSKVQAEPVVDTEITDAEYDEEDIIDEDIEEMSDEIGEEDTEENVMEDAEAISALPKAKPKKEKRSLELAEMMPMFVGIFILLIVCGIMTYFLFHPIW